MNRGMRTLPDRFDLGACYHLKDAGSCWIARCRYCSAGWLPAKDRRDAPELVAHALTHGIVIERRCCVPRPVRRRILVRIGGRLVGAITQRISASRAMLELGELATVEIDYESSRESHGLSPGSTLLTTRGECSPLSSAALAPEFTAIKQCVR